MMYRFLGLVVLVLGLSSPAVGQDDLPLAEDLINRYLEVIGGKELLGSLTNCVGEANLGGDRRIRVYYRTPNDMRREFIAEGRIVGMDVYLGERELAWAWQEGEEVSLVGEPLRSRYRQDAMFPKAARFEERYVSSATQGEEIIEGTRYYMVLMRAGNAPDELWMFNVETGLREMMRQAVVDGSGNAGIRTTVWSDWREVDGYTTPFRQTEFFKDQQATMIWETVELNTEFPPELFEVPAEVEALLAPPPGEEP